MTDSPAPGGIFQRLAVAGFTNLGYRLHARGFDDDLNDMSGKTVVVTGATGGLGLEAARRLADLGGRIVIVGRSEAKLDAAVASIGGNVVPMQADLSLMAEVRRMAHQLLDAQPRIDVLINNVGVLIPERRVTSEGLELSFATNLAGHFLLTNLLLPRMLQSAPARIIKVTSGGMYSAKIRPDDLQFERRDYTGTAAYAHTKRGQVILTEMWAEALHDKGIVVHVMHPGWARTAGVQQSLPTFDKLMRPFLRSPEQGADTIVWLAAAAQPAASTGEFWFDREVTPTHLTAGTIETADARGALWERLAALTQSDLPSTMKPSNGNSPG